MQAPIRQSMQQLASGTPWLIRPALYGHTAQRFSKPPSLCREGAHDKLRSRGGESPFTAPSLYSTQGGIQDEFVHKRPRLSLIGDGQGEGATAVPGNETASSVEFRVGPIQIDVLRPVENHQLGVRLDPTVHGRHFVKVGMAVSRAGDESPPARSRECLGCGRGARADRDRPAGRQGPTAAGRRRRPSPGPGAGSVAACSTPRS